MRTSAALVILACVLFVAQLVFGGGAGFHVPGVPVGMVPLALGAVLLPLGFIVGLVRGNAQYRRAVLLAMLGTVLVAFSLQVGTTGAGGFGQLTSSPGIGEIALLGATAAWALALVVAGRTMVRASSTA